MAIDSIIIHIEDLHLLLIGIVVVGIVVLVVPGVEEAELSAVDGRYGLKFVVFGLLAEAVDMADGDELYPVLRTSERSDIGACGGADVFSGADAEGPVMTVRGFVAGIGHDDLRPEGDGFCHGVFCVICDDWVRFPIRERVSTG